MAALNFRDFNWKTTPPKNGWHFPCFHEVAACDHLQKVTVANSLCFQMSFRKTSCRSPMAFSQSQLWWKSSSVRFVTSGIIQFTFTTTHLPWLKNDFDRILYARLLKLRLRPKSNKSTSNLLNRVCSRINRRTLFWNVPGAPLSICFTPSLWGFSGRGEGQASWWLRWRWCVCVCVLGGGGGPRCSPAQSFHTTGSKMDAKG